MEKVTKVSVAYEKQDAVYKAHVKEMDKKKKAKKGKA